MTARQSIALVVVMALGAGVIVAVALGWQSVAIALVGVLTVVAFLAVLQVQRRLGQGLDALGGFRVLEGRRHLEVRKELERVREEIQRERLAAAQRQQALLSTLRDLQQEMQRNANE